VSDRAAAMARSVVRAARSLGAVPETLERLETAHELAMEPRIARLPDDHHPAYLHPGRTVLVVLRDVGLLSGAALAAAAVLETEDRAPASEGGLRVPTPRIESALGASVAEWAEAVPLPGDEDAAERLVTLPSDAALVALAERLDQLRHLHLRDDLRASWASRHRETVDVWLPMAERSHPKLAARYAHWVRTFARRLRAD